MPQDFLEPELSFDPVDFRERVRHLDEYPDDPLQLDDAYQTWAQIGARDQLRATGIAEARFPLAVKANIAARGFALSAGTRALEASTAERAAGVVAALETAGAVVVGTTNMHELAFGVTSENGYLGSVRNPHDTRQTAGGSSGGSAAAVARGAVPLALGTDTGGSVSIPAAHCGVTGFRPTTGRWPADHIVGLSWTRDSPGIFATTVGDVAAADSWIACTPQPQPQRPRRIAIPAELVSHLDREVQQEFDTVVRTVAAQADVIDVSIAGVLQLIAGCEWQLVSYESRRLLATATARALDMSPDAGWAELRRQVLSPDVYQILQNIDCDPVSSHRYDSALRDAYRARKNYERLMAAAGIDALLFPTTASPAVAINPGRSNAKANFEHMTRKTIPGTVLRAPMLTLPLPAPAGAPPIGVTIQGPAFQDPAVLGLGRWLEAMTTRSG